MAIEQAESLPEIENEPENEKAIRKDSMKILNSEQEIEVLTQ